MRTSSGSWSSMTTPTLAFCRPGAKLRPTGRFPTDPRVSSGRQPSAPSAMRPAMENTRTLAEVDPEIAALVRKETERQEEGLELIASENFVSPAVMEAVGSTLTNKYAEGYPGKRYYGGCEFVDQVETLAIERAKALFGAEHANVQPHSGANANLAAYLSLLNPGDKILGLSLQEGGHLTHGLGVNFSGRLFEAHFYGVDPASGLLDYDAVLANA